MKDPRDLSLIRAEINFTEIKWCLSEHFFDAFEFAPQNLGHSRKDVNILDRNDGEPHSFSPNKASAVGHVGHSQISID